MLPKVLTLKALMFSLGECMRLQCSNLNPFLGQISCYWSFTPATHWLRGSYRKCFVLLMNFSGQLILMVNTRGFIVQGVSLLQNFLTNCYLLKPSPFSGLLLPNKIYHSIEKQYSTNSHFKHSFLLQFLSFNFLCLSWFSLAPRNFMFICNFLYTCQDSKLVDTTSILIPSFSTSQTRK